MCKILISVPDDLVMRLRTIIPTRQRSKVIAYLIAKEVEQRENGFYACALEAEKYQVLNKDLTAWDVTMMD